MVPVEWPIAAPASDGGAIPARLAGSDRLPAVRADFFLDPVARLSEQERSLMTGMLTDLVAMLADEFTAALAEGQPANDEGERVFDRLRSAGLLDMPELIALLLRRAEEERIGAGVRAGRPAGKSRFLQSLVGDSGAEISAAAMALILARGRRRDRFGGPRVAFDDLPAEVAVALVHAIAAACRGDLCSRMDTAEADERLSAAAASVLARHDEGNRLDAKTFDLVHALEGAGRLDEALIRSALEEGEVAIVTEALARLSGIGFAAAWEHLTGKPGQLALLVRMSRVSRDLAGEILAGTAEVLNSDMEAEIAAFDRVADEEVEAARKWLRLDPSYRSALALLALGHGQRTF